MLIMALYLKRRLVLPLIILLVLAVVLTGFMQAPVVVKNGSSDTLYTAPAAATRTLKYGLGTATPSPQLDNPLQKSTSKLYCSARTRSQYTPADYSRQSGYILVLSFREQLTKASNNLFDLQCWAKTLNADVNIVEPFVETSHLVVPLNSSKVKLFRFRDIFDFGVWRLLSGQHNFPPLVPWEEFNAEAPRQLIVVRFRYLTVKVIRQSDYKEGCETSAELSAKIEYLTEVYQFTVIREVCINFVSRDELSLLQFNQYLYGGIEPKSVTVLMEEWRGLGPQENGKRVVLPHGCSLSQSQHVESMTYAWPSQKLICDSMKYKQKYFQGEDYISVMVRTEKVGRLNNSREFMSLCFNKTLEQWRELKAATGIEKTFLAMDIGKYGSYSLVDSIRYNHPFLHMYSDFIKEVFGQDATIKSWEASFESIVSTQDRGYIGSLQKTLAAQGKCMVLTGGGSFQRHSRFIHNRINARMPTTCVQIIKKCSKGIKSPPASS